MKWIQPELWALQSGYGVRDGRKDGRTEWNQYTPNNFYEYFLNDQINN